jgi:hypothetical protein
MSFFCATDSKLSGLEKPIPLKNPKSIQAEEQEEYMIEHDMVVYMRDSEIPFSPLEKYLEMPKSYSDTNILQIPDKVLNISYFAYL